MFLKDRVLPCPQSLRPMRIPEIMETSTIEAIQTYILSLLIYYGLITMEKEPLLMLPGPVPMPERVRYAMMRQAINHRGAEFGQVYADCARVLKTCFGTKNELFVISGSGTAAMEAAVSQLSAGTRKLPASLTVNSANVFLKSQAGTGRPQKSVRHGVPRSTSKPLKNDSRLAPKSSRLSTMRHRQVS